MLRCGGSEAARPIRFSTRSKEMARRGNPNWQLGFASPNPGGRPKGSPNKATRTMQEVILKATDLIGGAEELARLYREDKAFRIVFWRDIAPKVLPKIIDTSANTASHLRTIE